MVEMPLVFIKNMVAYVYLPSKTGMIFRGFVSSPYTSIQPSHALLYPLVIQLGTGLMSCLVFTFYDTDGR